MMEKIGPPYLLSPMCSWCTTWYHWGFHQRQAGASVLSQSPFLRKVLHSAPPCIRHQDEWLCFIFIKMATLPPTHLCYISFKMTPHSQNDSWCLSFTPHKTISPWGWAGSSDSLLANRIWQKWWDITSEIRIQKDCSFCLLTCSL